MKIMRYQRAFTIVELLIVIVVIGILAALVIVAYNGIQGRAKEESLKVDIRNAISKLELLKIEDSDQYPGDASVLQASPGNTFQYSYNSTSNSYCVSVSSSTPGLPTYRAYSTTRVIEQGSCAEATWVAQTTSGTGFWENIESSSDGQRYVAVSSGSSSVLKTSADAGVTWVTRLASNCGCRDVAMSSDGTKIWLTRSTHTLPQYSSNSGSTWLSRGPAGPTNWSLVATSADGTRVAVTSVGSSYIYYSSNSGLNWTQLTTAGTRSWSSLAMSDDGTKLAAAAGGGDYIYTSTDSGATWVTQSAAGSRSWNNIAASGDNSRLIATASGGYIYRSSDGGTTWSENSTLGVQAWYDVAMSAVGNYAVLATGTAIYLSVDSGANWTIQTDAGTKDWRGAAISDDGTKFVGAARSSYVSTGVLP